MRFVYCDTSTGRQLPLFDGRGGEGAEEQIAPRYAGDDPVGGAEAVFQEEALDVLEASGDLSAELYFLKGELLNSLGRADEAAEAFDLGDGMVR